MNPVPRLHPLRQNYFRTHPDLLTLPISDELRWTLVAIQSLTHGSARLFGTTANEFGYFHLQMATIQTALGLAAQDARRTRKLLRALEDLGYLDVIPGGSDPRGNQYRLRWAGVSTPHPAFEGFATRFRGIEVPREFVFHANPDFGPALRCTWLAIYRYLSEEQAANGLSVDTPVLFHAEAVIGESHLHLGERGLRYRLFQLVQLGAFERFDARGVGSKKPYLRVRWTGEHAIPEGLVLTDAHGVPLPQHDQPGSATSAQAPSGLQVEDVLDPEGPDRLQDKHNRVPEEKDKGPEKNDRSSPEEKDRGQENNDRSLEETDRSSEGRREQPLPYNRILSTYPSQAAGSTREVPRAREGTEAQTPALACPGGGGPPSDAEQGAYGTSLQELIEEFEKCGIKWSAEHRSALHEQVQKMGGTTETLRFLKEILACERKGKLRKRAAFWILETLQSPKKVAFWLEHAETEGEEVSRERVISPTLPPTKPTATTCQSPPELLGKLCASQAIAPAELLTGYGPEDTLGVYAIALAAYAETPSLRPWGVKQGYGQTPNSRQWNIAPLRRATQYLTRLQQGKTPIGTVLAERLAAAWDALDDTLERHESDHLKSCEAIAAWIEALGCAEKYMKGTAHTLSQELGRLDRYLFDRQNQQRPLVGALGPTIVNKFIAIMNDVAKQIEDEAADVAG
jgi:hypothetical protein